MFCDNCLEIIQVWEVHLDNPFPLLRVTVNNGIRCLDLSQTKEKLAVVDETGLCQVFFVESGALYYKVRFINCDKTRYMHIYHV